VTETVGNELQTPEANSFTKGEANAFLVLAIDDDIKLWWLNHWNVQRKVRYKSPFLACQLSVFCAPANNRVYKITCF
jgi:hypothetical protein